MAYAITILREEQRVKHWGYGGEKSTEAMMAHGLIRGADVIFLEWVAPTIEVVTPKIGTEKYLAEFISKWLRQIADGAQGFSRDNFETWRKLHTLSELSCLYFRKPANRNERELANSMQELAQTVAMQALKQFAREPSKFSKGGVLTTDEDFALGSGRSR